ncbi:hypothetical protein KKA17_02140 [bacterium]|nr:hypothetical protein [bacterium]MBU1884796.1 hypothetical protein [bacterium]
MHIKTLLFFVLALFFSSLNAQEESSKTQLERSVEPKISFESSYISDAKVKDSQGSVSVSKNRIQLNNALFGISYTNWSFFWDNVSRLPFGDGVHQPIKELHSIMLHANLPYHISDDLFLLTSVSVKSTFEKETKDSYGAGFFGFIAYKIDDDNTLNFGAFANYHPVSTLVMPMASYSYRARKKDGLQAVIGFPRTYVGYSLNRDTLVNFGMIFSQAVVKLSDDSTIERSGYLEAQDYLGNVGISYDVSENFKIQGDLLYSIKRDFTIYNADGHAQESYSIDPSFGVNIRLTYTF